MLGGGGFAAVFTPAPHNGIFGDLNFDNWVNAADWTLFKAGQGMDFSMLTPLEAYQKGDLNGDRMHDLDDFWLFRTAFEEHNGGGSFARMLSVPEPESMVLLAFGVALSVAWIRQRAA